MAGLLPLCFITLLLLTSASANDDSDNETISARCPTWYAQSEDGSGRCICGDSLNGEIRCQEKEEKILLLLGSCITYTDGQVLASVCPYSPVLQEPRDDFYYPVPKNLSDVAEYMCGPLNRTGLFCSQCKEGLSLAALSYQRECVNCSNPTQGIILFIVLITIPVTAFFVLVMLCSIDVASGPMNSMLVTIDVAFTMINENPALYFLGKKFFRNLGVVLLTFYGIWNLDFLRYVIPPFCISKSLTPLQAEALEYVGALYPLLLIVLTYICVELYDNEYRVVVALWTPFKILFRSKYFNGLNIKYSLIKAFATFLLLSYSKIFNISRALLDCTVAKNSSGVGVKRLLAIDASTSYLSSTHIPYVVLAILMFAIFNIFPLFLFFLYPTRCFQLLLGKFSRVNWHPLRAFMDIFQGCYKNGTDGTWDCRYFSALNLLLRIIVLIPLGDNSMYLGVRLCVVLFAYVIMVSFAKPYQRGYLNYWEVFWYSCILIVAVSVLLTSFSNYRLLALYYAPIIFHIHVLSLFAVKFFKTFFPKRYNSFAEYIKAFNEKTSFPCCCYRNETSPVSVMEQGIVSPLEHDGEYPDRLTNPQDYEPLLCREDLNQPSAVRTYGITEST